MAKRRAKMKKDCTVRQIQFKTKRGKVVSFYGRKGGQTSHGGVCAVKADKPGEKAAQRRFATAARACNRVSKRPGTKRSKCMATQLG